MSFAAELWTAIVLAVGTYFWYQYNKIKSKLNWMPYAPGIPILGNALQFKGSTEHLPVLSKFIDLYGGLVRLDIFNRSFIVATDYKFLEFVLSTTKILDKSDDYKFLNRWLGTGLLTADGTKWKPRRKIITPAFHFSILEQFVEVFDANGKILIEKLEKENNKPSVNIYPYITLCALDIICETAMGVSVNAQNNTDSEYVFSVKEMCRIIIERAFSPWKMFDILYFFSQDYQKENKALKILHDYTKTVIHARIKELKQKNSSQKIVDEDTGVKKKMAFLDLLLQAEINGKPLTEEDIREEVDTFMFEGHDTTASAMSFALYCLATHKDVQEKVMEEQREIFGDDPNRPTTYRDLQDMKYLDVVIKEVLRLYPSVPFYGRYVGEDVEYAEGKLLPKGATITIYTYGINRNPQYYTDPDKFDPSRFEDTDGKTPFAYLPFSAGPRNCIGQKFAMLEMKCTVSKVIRNYQLLPSEPKHELLLAAETVLKSANGIHVKVCKRVWDGI